VIAEYLDYPAIGDFIAPALQDHSFELAFHGLQAPDAAVNLLKLIACNAIYRVA
tara:strand:- start:23 stop:184 length:162 start_codon:yes stop_codon:yes gene_type:complete